MSNYVKSTDFAGKDGLTSGDPAKIVKGTEIDDEFNAIATAVNSKANVNSPALTGVPTAPTAAAGTASTQLATTAFVINAIYPVGSIYTNVSVATNPATLFGFGTWESFGSGRVLVGVDSGDTAFDTLGETGGSKDAVVVSHTHTATVTDPGHSHVLSGVNATSSAGPLGATGFNGSDDRNPTSSATTDITVSNSTTGSSGTNANLQPYITVYMWKRTA